jgi:hypothetical protein
LLISCKDVNLTFGYEVVIDDYKNGKLFLYTAGGFLFNSNENNIKNIFSRLIISDNGEIKNYTPPIDY